MVRASKKDAKPTSAEAESVPKVDDAAAVVADAPVAADEAAVKPIVAKKARKSRSSDAAPKLKVAREKKPRAEFPNHPHSLRATYPTHVDCERCKRRRLRAKVYAQVKRHAHKDVAVAVAVEPIAPAHMTGEVAV